MARYTATVESTAALSASAPSGATANGLFANILSMASTGANTALTVAIRRLTLGVRAGTGAPNSQQMTVAFARTSARGTATTTNAWNDTGGSSYTPPSPGIDVAWSAVPTATWTAPYYWEVTVNTQAAADLPWELLELFRIPPSSTSGVYNGIALFNVGNALPSSHLYTLAVEMEDI
jgi:hypothetical protein